MNLDALQQILARLVTEPDLRDRFLDDPAKAAATEGWDTDLARAVSTISTSGLRQYGDALLNKRAREAARCLPLTGRALGCSRFAALFREYAAGTTTQGPRRHRDDAIAFAGALHRGARDGSEAPPWVKNLALYEAASLRCAKPTRCVLIVRLGYHPRDLANAAIAAQPVGEVPGCFALAVWFRLTRSGRLRRLCLASSRAAPSSLRSLATAVGPPLRRARPPRA